MKIIRYLSILILFYPLISFPQKKLTIEDASGMNRALYPTTLRNLQWLGSSDRFTYLENNAILIRKATSTISDTLMRFSEFNKILKKSGIDTLARIPSISWLDESSFTFTGKSSVYLLNYKNQTVSSVNKYPEEAKNIDSNPDGKLIAYTLKNNLFIASSGKLIQITNDENPGFVNGQIVSRNEFGINKGTFWSPSGKYLAYYRKDETMVTDYPLVNIDSRVATEEKIKYPMAGMASEQVNLVIYNIADGSYMTVKTGEPAEQYLTSVTWGPDEKDIYIGILNRGQNHLKLNRYDVMSGNLEQTLFEEKNDKYVEPEHPLFFLKSDPGQFIWFSERDGYQHLYLYDTKGSLIRQLTQGPWVVTSLLGTDPKGNKAFFLSTKNSPLNEDIFSVDLKSGKIQYLSLNTGVHSPVLSLNGKYLLDIFSDTLECREYAVIDNKRRVLQVISRSENPLHDYMQCKMQIFKLRSGDNTDLYSQMIFPPDFRPENKYPVIVYVYGGPHAQLVNNTWLGGSGLFNYYLAQQGYIIFTLDNRGSANRGLEFEQAVFRNLGTLEVSDQMVGINYLKNLPYVDPDRIGVQGWSYGGFMTISLMLREPEVFKVGVCGGPVTDWKYYEVMYGERYMDTPEENPDGYKEASLLERAGSLKGDLLVIQGTSDPVVVWQQSLTLMKRFIEEGKMVDYFVYPGHEHGVGGKARVHLNRKIEKYFVDHL
ncbi:MAG: S9 family peptidase [Bacteroidales bacterium]|nr:S9 family peptidase [Bacteroidales bacterium]